MTIPLIMTLFIILGRLTHKAIDTMKGAKDRDVKAEQIIKEAGGKLMSHYYTIGHYDFVALVELPSPEALARVLIEIGKGGTASTETMTALNPEQVYKVAMGT
jgi:uncharacterized protein with GYD domain